MYADWVREQPEREKSLLENEWAYERANGEVTTTTTDRSGHGERDEARVADLKQISTASWFTLFAFH